MGYKYHNTRVHSLTADLNPGDHIRVFRIGLYYHHMLVVEVISGEVLLVIHYTESELEGLARSSCCVSSSGQNKARVIEERICFDLRNEKVELLKYERDVPINVGRKAVKRARERLGEEKYNLLHNNCESFVNWAITGRSTSNQVETGMAVAIGATVGAVTVGAVAVGAVALLAGLKLMSDSSDEPEDKKKRNK